MANPRNHKLPQWLDYCIIQFLGKTMLAGYLMGKGAKLQLTDKDGDNALHWAGFKGKYRLYY